MLREAPQSPDELNEFIKELNLNTFANKSRLKLIIKKLNKKKQQTFVMYRIYISILIIIQIYMNTYFVIGLFYYFFFYIFLTHSKI